MKESAQIALSFLRSHRAERMSTLPPIFQGLGVAVVPDFAALTDYPMLRVLRIAGPPLPWELSLATASHGRPSPALRALLPLLDRYISGP